jgi:hypothetical protein
MSMSLDGYVADLNDGVAEVLPAIRTSSRKCAHQRCAAKFGIPK